MATNKQPDSSNESASTPKNQDAPNSPKDTAKKQPARRSTGAAKSKTAAAKDASKSANKKPAASAAPDRAEEKKSPKAPAVKNSAASDAQPEAQPGAAPQKSASRKSPATKTTAAKTTAAKASAKKAAPQKQAKDQEQPASQAEKASSPKSAAQKTTAEKPAPSGSAKSAAKSVPGTGSATKKTTTAAKKTGTKQKDRPVPSAAQEQSEEKSPAKSAAKAAAKKSAPKTADALKQDSAANAPKKPARRTSAKTTSAKKASTDEKTLAAPFEGTLAASAAADAATPAVAEAPAVQIDAPAADAPAADAAPSGRSRGRRGGRSASAKKAAALKDSLAVQAETPSAPAEQAHQDAPADFPMGFGDTGPEDIFANDNASGDDASGEAAAGEGKKRRSRRGGRGRKKSHTAEAATQAQQAAPEPSAPEPSVEGDDAQDTDDDEALEAPDSTQAQEKKGRRKMFVSVLSGEQVEVVITEEAQVQEYYVEMLHQAKIKGNIYKGVVHNVDANLQAAFVSYGQVKNGFLQIDEVHPEYYVTQHEAAKGRKYPPIQKVLKPGQEVLVQVVKEPAGTKGAFLTTYLSLPGRFLVLTPGREQIGVSRKVDNEAERARLRELLEGLTPGPGLGVIVRTVSMGASKTNLQRDLQFLKRTWKDVRTRGTTEKAPCLIYQEMDLTARAVRDYLTDAINEIWIDDEQTAASVTEVAEALFPRKKNLVRLHDGTSGASLFERFNIQRQLDQIHSREVSLPSGGRLVIDPTEALTAIDINSGRSGGKSNFEDMAYRTNMEAAKMIPLQLRLRDIGGQVVADFIEMRDRSHWREVEKTLRNGMKVDRARYDVGKIGPFGMLEIVRQRLGSSAISISTEPCPCCNGTGVRRNVEWQSQHALRDIQRLLRNAQAQKEKQVTYEAEALLALHLLNHKRGRLLEMEQAADVSLEIAIKGPDVQ